MGMLATGQFTIVDTIDGKNGTPGPALSISATAQGFTFVDGVASPAEQYIGFQAVNYATDTPVTWYTSTGAYLLNDDGRLHVEGLMTGMYGAGNGELAYMSLAQFGSADQITVTAVCGELSATFMVMRLSKSTAAAGATVGAPAGTTVGGVLAETVRDNAANALTAANTANTNLANKQDKASSDILTISTTDAVRMAGIRVGDMAWNGSGVRTSGKGLALTPQGLLGHNGTKTTFSIDAVTGNATFAGAIEVGTATVAVSQGRSQWAIFPTSGATVDVTLPGVTLDSTGSRVTVIGMLLITLRTDNLLCTRFSAVANLLLGGISLSWPNSTAVLAKVNLTAAATPAYKIVEITIPINFSHTPSAGANTYSIGVNCACLDANSNGAGWVNGIASFESTLLITENKI